MKKLKVLFITSWYPTPESPVNGTFVREHAKAVSLYNEVVVLHLDEYSQKVKGLYGFQEKEIEGIRTIRLNYRRFPVPFIKQCAYFNYICTAILAFRKIVKSGFKPDIIHANVYTSGVPAVIIGKIFKVPVLITEHFSAFPRQILSKGEIKKAKFAFERAQYVLPVSKSLQEAIEFYGIKAKFEVMPNVVDTNIFHPDNQLKKENNIKKILLVALLEPNKGIPYLFQALHLLNLKRNDFFLDIIGDGPNRAEYEKLATELNIANKICFYGIKTKQEIAGFMRQSDFFVLPSLHETFGVVLIEALASGVPVIATNIGGPNEIINKNVGILVLPKDAVTLTQEINFMLDNYEKYSSAIITEYARSNFSFETVGRKFTKIYERLNS